MEKKIGIYTFTAANNYGAVLQAFALKQHLCNAGFDAHCVDYRPLFLTERFKPFPPFTLQDYANPLKLIKMCLKWNKIRKKNALFEQFKENALSFIPVGSTDVDTYIVGSDQVWNYKITCGDRIFLGNIPHSNGHIISYAASMEQDLDEKWKMDFKEQLKNFSCISVREENLQHKLKNDYGINSTLVVDPTLLLSRSQWSMMGVPYKKATGRFIFMYGFGFSQQEQKNAELYAKEHKLKLIIASSGVLLRKGYSNNISPQQFVWLIEHAECIITNSFHGTVFSLIFGKRFAISKKNGLKKNNRVANLLQLYGMDYVECDIDKMLKDDIFLAPAHLPNSICEAINRSKQFLVNTL